MSIRAGIVGLPNVGKSTLFNALTKSSVPAENYPFCTVDPHVAITHVPDERLEKLQKIFQSQKLVPSTVTFVDIAGLVKGAAAGEGLGNAFLSNIREVDLILHVVRCFKDSNIASTKDSIDPLDDYETIVSELMLKDLESVEKRLLKIEGLIKKVHGQSTELKKLNAEKALLLNVQKALNDGDNMVTRKLVSEYDRETIALLSAKKSFIIANVSEDDAEGEQYKNNPYVKMLIERFGKHNVIPVCAKLELELSQLPDAEALDLTHMMNIKIRSLDTIITTTYANLGLITFFTCGPKEVHAWPIRNGMTVREAAGEIHSDLQRGFICAQVFNCDDIFQQNSVVKLKEHGRIRREGQDYIVKDGDIIEIRFNV